MRRRSAAILLLLAAAAVAVGCIVWQLQSKAQKKSCQQQLFAMDTVMTFTAYGPKADQAVADAVAEVQRLDALWSVGNPASEVSQLNANGQGQVSEDTAHLLGRAQDIYGDTGGLFDPTIYPLMELWGFPSGNYHVPTQAELDALLPLVDGASVTLSGRTAALGDGQRLDLGGIAKGYASARVMDIFRAHGVTSGMVSLGGNIQVLGSKVDASPWHIGIRDPEGGVSDILGALSVSDKAVITSGGYERWFEENGQTYIHILDPRTGRPAQSDLLSATVVSADGTLADGLSTALYIMGLEDATAFWRARSDDFDMVLVTADKTVYLTQGIAQDFQSDARCVILR